MLYREAARIIEAVQEKKASTKSLVLNSKFKNKKQLFALVCQTLKYRPVLMKILENTKIQKHEKILKQDSLAQVAVYDFLIGKGSTQFHDKIKGAVYRHKSALKSELARIMVKEGAHKTEDLLPDKVRNEVVLPRYVRVNTLKTSVMDVVTHFRKDGYTQIQTQTSDYQHYILVVKSLEKNHFLQDIHLPELLVFAAGTDLHEHVLYKSGDIILQDKASCIPAFVLSPPPGSEVIDCCAAPGNKTSHLAAIMKNKGKIHAFDIDVKRLATLRTMLLQAGVLCASSENIDFLRCDPQSPPYKDTEYILLDPSCSGSGIVSRMNEVTDDDQSLSASRLENLARVQLSLLVHAMCFPKVKRLVYSTCSVHEIENELVVNRALQLTNNQFKLITVMKDIPSRGHQLSESSSSFKAGKCLRLDPKDDLTNGFFVALLQKRNNVTGNVGDILRETCGKNIICPLLDVIEETADRSNPAEILEKKVKKKSRGLRTEKKNLESKPMKKTENAGSKTTKKSGKKKKRKYKPITM